MKIQKALRLAALLLCAALLLAACQTGAAESNAPGQSGADASGQAPGQSGSRRTIPYGDMAYTRPDTQALAEEIDRLRDELAEAPDFAAALELVQQCDAAMEEFSTMYALADIARLQNAADPARQQETKVLAAAAVELTQHLNAFNQQVVEGPYAANFKAEWGEHYFAALEMSLLFSNEGVKAYQAERAELAEDYAAMLATHTVEHSGQQYTYQQIAAVDSSTLSRQLYELYYQTYLDEYAQLYARQVQLDKETAYDLGFESAAAMYYLQYGRDYAPADSQALFQSVRETLVPLWLDTAGAYANVAAGGYASIEPFALQDALAAMPAVLEQFGPAFADSWQGLAQYGLYDCAPTAQKQQGVAYTWYLPAYDAPFLYMNWNEDFNSLKTLAHEYGHFHSMWQGYSGQTAPNLDWDETCAYGMEMLMAPRYADFVPGGLLAEKAALSTMMRDSLLYQCALEDFQLRVYEMDTFDGPMLGRALAEVMEEYGFDTSGLKDATGAANHWIGYATLFDTPFYTASYVTSASTALQLWATAREDWQGAVALYQAFAEGGPNRPYTQAVHAAGLKMPGEEGALQEVAAAWGQAFADAAPQGDSGAEAGAGSAATGQDESLPEAA